MIGIGHRLEKYTKMNYLKEKSKEYNEKYEALLAEGIPASQAVKRLQEEEEEKRQQKAKDLNSIGGATHLGYTETHKALTSTQTLYAGTKAKAPTPDKEEQQKIRERIERDHLQEDAEVDFGEKILSDYKKHFVDDQKMDRIRHTKDKQFHQRKNDLKWYAETYIKTKESLRKC